MLEGPAKSLERAVPEGSKKRIALQDPSLPEHLMRRAMGTDAVEFQGFQRMLEGPAKSLERGVPEGLKKRIALQDPSPPEHLMGMAMGTDAVESQGMPDQFDNSQDPNSQDPREAIMLYDEEGEVEDENTEFSFDLPPTNVRKMISELNAMRNCMG